MSQSGRSNAAPDGLPKQDSKSQPCTLAGLLLYFLRLGAVGFGGPVVLVGYMQQDLVEARGWISREEYLEGLALSELLPGPLAAQLAMYLGWVRYGVIGATLVGAVFILPSFLMVIILSILYMRLGGIPWIQWLFYGIGAAVTAIIVKSAYRLMKTTLGKDWLLWVIFALSGLITVFTKAEIVWMFILGGLAAVAIRSSPGRPAFFVAGASFAWLITGLKGPASPNVLLKIALFFTKAGAFVFGSGLAIVPFLYEGVVKNMHWLTERQFLDAVAVAMITPGPVVIGVAFIGYMVAGVLGAITAALGVFLPPYLFVIILAKHFHYFAQNKKIKLFVDGLTSAVIGAIVGAAFILGRQAIKDIPTLVIAITSLAAIVNVKKIPEPLVILAAGAAGVVLRGVG